MTFGSEGETVVIQDVQSGSAAAASGLAAGDRVKKLDRHNVTSLDGVHELFSAKARLDIHLDGDAVAKRVEFAPPPRSPPLQPTQIYSAINAALLCLLLVAYYPFRRRDGEVFALLLTISCRINWEIPIGASPQCWSPATPSNLPIHWNS